MKWFVNKKISQKLTIGFIIITLLGLIIGIVGIANVKLLARNEQDLYNGSTMGAITIGNAQEKYLNINVIIRDLVIHYDLDKATYYDGLQNAYEGIEKEFDVYDKTITDPQDRINFDKLKGNYLKYKDGINKIVEAAKAEKPVNDILVLMKQIATVGSITTSGFNKVSNFNASLASDKVAKDSVLSNNLIYIMGGILLVSVIIAVLLSTYISRLIGKPLNVMSENAERIALGDVDITIDNSKIRKDEIGRLENAFLKVIEGIKVQAQDTQRLASGDLTVEIAVKSDKDVLNQSLITLVENLNDVIISIQNSAEQVSSGSNLMSDSSLALSQGATEQASSVQQLTASLEEIASQTTLNAQSAQQANELAQNAKSDAETGYSQMKDMLNAMDDINISSRDINKIIKVIDAIAFQTNILALNAAVEAARAGQHGKGFAVVAEEVRTLAARSAQAAKQTTDLIEKSIKKVEVGTKIANTTADALGKIVNEVTRAAELVESIAIASNTQASAIEQINQGVLQVSRVVQNNAATAEESAAASEELSSQADQLTEIVSTFNVKSNGIKVKAINAEGHDHCSPVEDTKVIEMSVESEELDQIDLSLDEVDIGKY